MITEIDFLESLQGFEIVFEFYFEIVTMDSILKLYDMQTADCDVFQLGTLNFNV